MTSKNTPEWAEEGKYDIHGNVFCKNCHSCQSDVWINCIHCCSHDELNVVEKWVGQYDAGEWCIDAECKKCGKDFFEKDEIMKGYKLVKVFGSLHDRR